ncbi:MAG: UPF0158 family protein [Myxococcota bacterium]|nr:UPF0158 family protein [Myxococcota bacterium]
MMDEEMMNDVTASNDVSERSEDTAPSDAADSEETLISEDKEPAISDDSEESWRDEDQDRSPGEHWRPSTESITEGEDSTREIKVAVDWVELEGALENNSPELHSFLNIVTGDVVRIFEGGENAEMRLKQSEASPDFIYIEPVSSREQYRWMEEYIEIVEEPTLKDKLNIAIDGKGAFRRFKDVLVGYPAERERWFSKRATKLRAHMKEWLTSKHIFPTNLPPWEGEREDEVRRPRADYESRGFRDGSVDLRNTARELIDMMPSRELPTAVAFLEFLRSRRTYRRSRYS